VTINNKSGELRTGKDKIDFEEITAINYIVTASDGELSDDMGVSYTDQRIQFPKNIKSVLRAVQDNW
jgi:hypothetical protein